MAAWKVSTATATTASASTDTDPRVTESATKKTSVQHLKMKEDSGGKKEKYSSVRPSSLFLPPPSSDDGMGETPVAILRNNLGKLGIFSHPTFLPAPPLPSPLFLLVSLSRTCIFAKP